MENEHKINLLYMLGHIISNHPEPRTTYVKAGQNLIWKSVLLQYEYRLT